MNSVGQQKTTRKSAADRTKRTTTDNLLFKVVRSNSHDELLAQAVDLIITLGPIGGCGKIPGGLDRVTSGCARDREEPVT
jgi:hypothetical protein